MRSPVSVVAAVAVVASFAAVAGLCASSLVGCTAANPNYTGKSDGHVSEPDGHAGPDDLGHHEGPEDLAVVVGRAPDLATERENPDLRLPGEIDDPCTTSCDCQPGLFCYLQKCAQSMQGPIFCCASTTCPTDQECEQLDGTFGHCPGHAPPPPDASVPVMTTPAYCKYVYCLHDTACSLSGCGTCDTMKNHCKE